MLFPKAKGCLAQILPSPYVDVMRIANLDSGINEIVSWW